MSGHYNVAPKYSAGSPASVPEHIARRVAEEERRCYDDARAGHYGEGKKAQAEKEGLRGIVEWREERRGAWEVEDLITGERARRWSYLRVGGSGYGEVKLKKASTNGRVKEAEQLAAVEVAKLLIEDWRDPEKDDCVVSVTKYYVGPELSGDLVVAKVTWPARAVKARTP